MHETARPAVFVRIDTAEPIRIWTGSYFYDLPADAVETTGGLYAPLGLEELPVIDMLVQGQAGEYTFTVSGLPEATMEGVQIPPDLAGAKVSLGELKFDDAWQPTGAVDWFKTLEAETVGYSDRNDGDDVDSPRMVQLGFTVSSSETDRRGAPNLHWSEIEQREIAPTDRAFDYVNRYSSGSRRQFPA